MRLAIGPNKRKAARKDEENIIQLLRRDIHQIIDIERLYEMNVAGRYCRFKFLRQP